MNEDIKKYLPIGAGLLGAAGIYALMRAPIWGAKSFAPLRKQFGNEATLILSKETEKINPTLSKILSGFDKTIIADSAKVIPRENMKGLTLDLRPTMSSSADIKLTPSSFVSKLYPGTMMENLSSISKIFPETKVLKATDDKFLETPAAMKEYILNATKGIEVENTILKPGTMGSKLNKVYKTNDVIDNPDEFFNVLKNLQKREKGPLQALLGGQYNAAFYLQKEIPGETYRATLINDVVVPGSVTKRHNLLGSVIEKIMGGNSGVEKRLTEVVKKVPPFKSSTHELFNPDFQVIRDSAGNIADIKIIDLNWNGAAGNIVPNTNPIGSWTLSKALTGKQPKILAATGAAISGSGTYYFTRKKKKST